VFAKIRHDGKTEWQRIEMVSTQDAGSLAIPLLALKRQRRLAADATVIPSPNMQADEQEATTGIPMPNQFAAANREHGVVIRVYDAAGNVIETYEHASEFKEW
jgi:hypothetical protein